MSGAQPAWVVRGQPTAHELAALVTVIAARTGRPATGAPGAARSRPGGWADPARRLRAAAPLRPRSWSSAALS